METIVKLIPKSKSSHELLGSPVNRSTIPNSATGTNLAAITARFDNRQQQQIDQNFLQVPGQYSNHGGSSSNSSSRFGSSMSESSELSQLSDFDSHEPKDKESARKLKKYKKSIRKQRKKNEKQLNELIQFLHVDADFGSGLDEDDLKYLNESRLNSSQKSTTSSLESAADLRPKRKIGISKSLNMEQTGNSSTVRSLVVPLQIGNNNSTTKSDTEPDKDEEDKHDYTEDNEKTITNSNNDTITAGGFRRIRRFGYDVEDGCGFPLSLKKETTDADQLKKKKTWNEIIFQANEYLNKQKLNNKKIAINQLYEICPCPEVEFATVNGVLPFRRWNSELRLNASFYDQAHKCCKALHLTSSDQIVDLSNKAHSPNRKSCEDLRHLTTTGSFSLFERELQQKRSKCEAVCSVPTAIHINNGGESGCNSSEFSSEYSNCSLRSVSSSNSSISGCSTLVGLDLNQIEINPFEVFLHYFEPRLVAIELTKIEIELFLQLNCTEISREIFSTNRGLNITQFFEIQCIYFFVQLILSETHLPSRVNCLRLCIELMKELHRLRNWQSFNSILVALHCIPIVRLKLTWNGLKESYPEVYQEFCKLSETSHVNHDHYLLHNHAQASIPCLSELLNEIRARIAFKINQLDCRRRPKLFGRPETLTDWLTSEVRNLQTLLYVNQQLDETEDLEKLRKQKKSNLLKKIVKSFTNKNRKTKKIDLNTTAPAIINNNDNNNIHNNSNISVDLTKLNQSNITTNSSNSSSSTSNTSSNESHNLNSSIATDEDRVDDELILMKTVNSNYRLDEWRQIQMDLKLKMNKLKPEVENSILGEINKCLSLHQRLAYNYNFDCEDQSDQIRCSNESKINSIIKRCLVQLTKLNANTMEENMKKSLKVEPHQDEKIG